MIGISQKILLAILSVALSACGGTEFTGANKTKQKILGNASAARNTKASPLPKSASAEKQAGSAEIQKSPDADFELPARQGTSVTPSVALDLCLSPSSTTILYQNVRGQNDVPVVDHPEEVQVMKISGTGSNVNVRFSMMMKDFPQLRAICLSGTGNNINILVETDLPSSGQIVVDGTGTDNRFELRSRNAPSGRVGGTGQRVLFRYVQSEAANIVSGSLLAIRGTGTDTKVEVVMASLVPIEIGITGSMKADVQTHGMVKSAFGTTAENAINLKVYGHECPAKNGAGSFTCSKL